MLYVFKNGLCIVIHAGLFVRVDMSIEDTGPTRPQLDEFFSLCGAIDKEDRLPWDRNKSERKNDLWHNLNVFLEGLQTKNLVSMAVYAQKGNQPEIVKLLIKITTDFTARDGEGNTMLHVAVNLNDQSILTHLLENGVEIETINQDGKSALELAVESGCRMAVRILVRAGADIFGTSGSRQSTLHFIQDLIADRAVDRMTPKFEETESFLSEIDNSVRRTVFEIDRLVIQERNLAVLMATHKRLGELAGLRNIDEKMIREFVLEEVSSTYHGGVQNQRPDVMKQMIIDAYRDRMDRIIRDFVYDFVYVPPNAHV